MGRLKAAARYREEVREILHCDWVPMGGPDRRSARSEYDAYVHRICLMLVGGEPSARIAERLWRIETSGMGLSGDRTRAERIADRLVGLNKRPRTRE